MMFGSNIEAVDFSCLKSRMNKLTMTIQLGFFFQDHRVSFEKLWSSWNSFCVCQESLKSEIAHVLVRILRKKRLPPCTSDLWTEFVSSLSFFIFFFLGCYFVSFARTNCPSTSGSRDGCIT